jgi:hypothetical protein
MCFIYSERFLCLQLLYMRPHTAVCRIHNVSGTDLVVEAVPYYCYICVHILMLYYCYICVNILLYSYYMCAGYRSSCRSSSASIVVQSRCQVRHCRRRLYARWPR